MILGSTLLPGGQSHAQERTLDAVSVTSSTIDDRFAGKRGEASSVSEISGRKVDERRAENIIQVLQAIPGITADLSSGDEIKIKFRGVENQVYMGEKPGVAIVIDGVPVFERTGKVNIDLDNIESIKVIKGGASYLFGEDALAGALVITTKRGAKYAGLTVAADAGAWGYQRQQVRAGLAGDWGSGHLQATHRASDDYYFQSAYQTDYLDGSLRFNLSERSDLTINGESSARRKDKHGNVVGAAQAAIDPRGTMGKDYARKFDVDLDKINATYAHDLEDAGNLLATVYQYRDHTVYWSGPIKYYTSGQQVPANVTDAYGTNNDYHQTQRGAKGEWRASKGELAWMGGLDLRHNEYLNYNSALSGYCTAINSKGGSNTGNCVSQIAAGAVAQNDKTDERTRAAYGELKWAANADWVFTGNLRADAIKLDYLGQPSSGNGNNSVAGSKDFSATSWRLGANWLANRETTLFANVSTGFRTPTATQLYAGSISPTGKTLNNTDLKPETSMNYEVGVHADAAAFGIAYNVQASLFQIDRKDYIMQTNGDYGGNDPSSQKWDNIGGVRNRGLELAFKSDASRPWSVDAAYTYVSAKFTHYDNLNQVLGNPYAGACASGVSAGQGCYRLVHFNNTGKSVPRVPAQQLFTTLNWRPQAGLRLALEMDARAFAYADEINQERLPGRTLYNLALNYELNGGKASLWDGKWSFFARLDNLFDRNYWTAARGTNDAIGNIAGQTSYNGVYNANDLSIIVGKPRYLTAGVTASF
jgi:iron complex outermembrane receptor protein